MGEKGGTPAFDGTGMVIAVVTARFNEDITGPLRDAAIATLRARGATAAPIIWVPGAVELPLAAQAVARAHRPDAILALGCVIKGETAHFEQVATQASAGVVRVGLDEQLPCVLGILTTYDRDQAVARIEKGAEAADTAIEMVALLRGLRAPSAGS